MDDMTFASVNTAVRIRESEFLTKDQFETLLKANDFAQAQQLLKTTVYDQLLDPFEGTLMSELGKAYDFVDDVASNAPVTQLFSLSYTYHNLKVLLKNHLAGLDITDAVIPIGAYNLEALSYLVKTEQSDSLPTIMVETVQEIAQEYREYGRLEAIDVLLDRRYFKHLLQVVKELGDDGLQQLVRTWADLYNVSCIFRLRDKKLTQAFLKSILSTEGNLALEELIKLALQQQFDAILTLLSETTYGDVISPLLESERDVNLSLEIARDQVAHVHLEEARFEAFGYLPLLAYLYYKEMEVKNLRLILTGKVNGFAQEILKERMRPIYGL